MRAGRGGAAEGIMSISLRNTPALLTRTHLGPYTSLPNQHNALGGREVARREPNGAVWKSLLPGHLLKVERLSPSAPPPFRLPTAFIPISLRDRGNPGIATKGCPIVTCSPFGRASALTLPAPPSTILPTRTQHPPLPPAPPAPSPPSPSRAGAFRCLPLETPTSPPPSSRNHLPTRPAPWPAATPTQATWHTCSWVARHVAVGTDIRPGRAPGP